MYWRTQFSAHQSLRNFQKRLKPEFYYVLCDVFIKKKKKKKKRVKCSTVDILKHKLAQSGDGQAWGRPRRSLARRWREIRRSSDRRRRSWYPISPITVVKWLSGCENDRRATVVTLHDTGPCLSLSWIGKLDINKIVLFASLLDLTSTSHDFDLVDNSEFGRLLGRSVKVELNGQIQTNNQK